MWICVCNSINTRKVLEAKDQGASKPYDVFVFHGCDVCCGKCCTDMRIVLKEEQENILNPKSK